MLDESFIRLIIGPVGSGKSAGCFMELLRRAKMQAPDARGRRLTRFAIIRNTLPQLRQTCLADIQLWLGPMMTFKVAENTIQIRTPLPDGTKVISDWMLIPLDTKEDQQRLLSLNLTGAWVSEFREVSPSLIDALSGRLGRFPAKAIVPCSWKGIVAESNPPDEDSEWYHKLEKDKPPNWTIFRQPGGTEPNAENVENLPDGYYDLLVANNSPDWVDVHVHAKYGKSLSGQAVWRASFKPEFHIVDEYIEPQDHIPIMIGHDFGRTPACLFGQVDNRGRLVIMRELFSTDKGLEQFTITETRPLIYRYYMGRRIFVVCDPAGNAKGPIGEESPIKALKRLGFDAFPAVTNDIDPRIRAVEQLFLQQIDGGPALMVSGPGCPTLVHALKHGYRYRRKKTGDLEDRPEKTHPWSDLADCLQYMALSVSSNSVGRIMAKLNPAPPQQPPSVRGWT
jgi:hypothetical protein